MAINNPILTSISNWFQRNFADPGAVSLFMTIILGLIFLEYFGSMLTPILVSIVIAYLLNAVVNMLKRWHVPNILAVLVVYIIFLGTLLYIMFGLLPLLFRELSNLVQEAPKAITAGQVWLQHLSQKYPAYLSAAQFQTYAAPIQHQLASSGQEVLKYSLSTIPNIIHLLLYLVLVPLFVFFFLKDSHAIITWASQYMPKDRGLSLKVWQELNKKIGAYVKGRVLEVLIISAVGSASFALLGLNYAVLFGVAFGVAVIIPYVGAIVVTIPIVIVALLQFGLSAHFAYFLGVYALLNIADGNFLVPYLFSESMDLHPLVILLSVVVFGDLWGFWGIFFAIPIATLIDVILRNWPRGK